MASGAADSPRRGRRSSRRAAKRDESQDGDERERYQYDDDPPSRPVARPAAVVPAGPVRKPAAAFYPPYLLALGAAAFTFYTALYLLDAAITYYTYVPGNAVPVLQMYHQRRFNGRKIVPVADLANSLTTAWGAIAGYNFPVSASLGRLPTLVAWSFGLDLAAFSVSLFLVLNMWRHSPRDPSRLRRLPWTLGFRSPRTMMSNLAFVSVMLYGFVAVWRSGNFMFFASNFALLAYVMTNLTGFDSFISARLPASCQLQLAISFIRLLERDPYQHQVTPVIAVVQLLCLVRMFRHARRATDYYFYREYLGV